MNGLGISTAWLATRVETGGELLRAVEELGLDCLEVDYRVGSEVTETIRQAVNRGTLRVISVHNPAPLPPWLSPKEASGDALRLSSLDEAERRRAVELALRSLRLASELGAEVVVFHLGEVEFDHQSQRLFSFYRENKIGSAEYELFLEAKLRERAERRGPHLEAVMRSLEEIHEEAAELGIWLGIENRFYYHQIPDLEEFDLLFRRFDGGRLRYWHDTGHAQVFEALGFWRQIEPLQRYGDRVVGFHLHDCRGIDDHRAPGDGDIRWRELLPYLEGEDVRRVLEIHPKVSPEQARRGIDFLTDLGVGVACAEARRRA
jgi:sugar phosphate isomerase/epimerase